MPNLTDKMGKALVRYGWRRYRRNAGSPAGVSYSNRDAVEQFSQWWPWSWRKDRGDYVCAVLWLCGKRNAARRRAMIIWRDSTHA